MKTAIVTGGTKNDVDAMAVLALNLQDVSPNLADKLIIYHDGISKKKQDLIQNIMPTKFVRYKCQINWFKMMSNRTIRYFSPMVFCKFECLRLLEEYDSVIWTDYDIVIRDNIEELKYKDAPINVIVNKDTKLKEMFYPTIKEAKTIEFDLEGDSVTTPLFIVKKELHNYMEYYNWCYDMTRKYIKHLYLPEQCIWTMLVQKFNLQYDELDMEMYCYHPNDATEKTKILHAYGQPKFWNGLDNEQWNRYYEEWKKMQ
jgi:lipopolysaccharide biosynthesis glycosyltransferase